MIVFFRICASKLHSRGGPVSFLIPPSFTQPPAIVAFGAPCSPGWTEWRQNMGSCHSGRTGVGAAWSSIHLLFGHVQALGMRAIRSKVCSLVMVKGWNCVLLALKPYKMLSTFHQHHTRSNKHTTRSKMLWAAMEIPFKLGSQIWCGVSNTANWTDSWPGPFYLKGAGYSASPPAKCRRSRERRTGASASQSENLQGFRLFEGSWWSVMVCWCWFLPKTGLGQQFNPLGRSLWTRNGSET